MAEELSLPRSGNTQVHEESSIMKDGRCLETRGKGDSRHWWAAVVDVEIERHRKRKEAASSADADILGTFPFGSFGDSHCRWRKTQRE